MTAPGITANEARRIAARWIGESSPDLSPQLYEFDAGYVVWGAGSEPQLGAGRGVIDRETGELSVWPALPVEVVAQRYRAERAAFGRPLPAGDQLTQARRDLDRVGTPATITYLLLDGPPVTARSIKGDSEPQHHPLVADALRRLPLEFRERGYQRCSEIAALSSALLADDVRRGRPATLDEARKRVFRGAELVTYRVREPADPQDAVPGAPCLSCLAMLAYFGFDIAPPEDFWPEVDS
ncbi:YwqJ-related putative deaminase [Cryptosporangium phraense]|uniref:YwqJ-related putative deaminase n=1 Tax=Cryptosporangium phraense TaxID=2593070 RepID=UPI001478C8EC|nr:YwqJ-related putative deaminase [Cryptosporangium phraense]